MTDYQLQPGSRACCVTGRELKPGEKYYCVLLEAEGKFIRQEYAQEAWSGPPAGAFSYWLGKIPGSEKERRPNIDDEVILDCFQRLEGQQDPARVNFRFVLALLLMRRKKLRFEDARVEGDREILILRQARSKTLHEVVNPRLSEEETMAVQEEVFKVLGW
jgi:hypothetical protein